MLHKVKVRRETFAQQRKSLEPIICEKTQRRKTKVTKLIENIFFFFF